MIVDEADPPVFMRILDALPDAVTSATFLFAWIFPHFFSLDFLGNLASLVALEVAFCIVLALVHIRLDMTKTTDYFIAIIVFSLCAVGVIVNMTPTPSGMLVLVPYGLIIFSKLNYSVFRESTSITTRKRNFFAGFSCVVCLALLVLVILLPVPHFGMNEELAMSLPSPGGMLDWGHDNTHIAYAFGSLHFMIVAVMRYRWSLQVQRSIWT